MINRRSFLQSALVLGALTKIPRSLIPPMGSEVLAATPIDYSRYQNPKEFLYLAEGFECTLIERVQDSMSEGLKVPGRFDGMGVFLKGTDEIVLMRNHELERLKTEQTAYATPEAEAGRPHRYDQSAYGGVSRLVLDRKSLQKKSSNLVLEGTIRNCSGGVSPWGWLSCEETFDEHHGYVFLCSHEATGTRPPQVLKNYGKFYHEAIVIDPDTHVAYLTEDRDDSCFYRFVPFHKDRPFEGVLQALVVSGRPRLLTGKTLQPGEKLSTSWVTLTDINPKQDTLRYEAQKKGAAIFARGEGMVRGEKNQIYFCASSGGPVEAGQIFVYEEGQNFASLDKRQGELTLLAHSTSRQQLDMPDNITLAPTGEVFICEDGWGASHIRAVSPGGRVLTLAESLLPHSELAGLCFDPDGQTLFVNSYSAGMTLAIRGPFATWMKEAKE